VFRLEKGAGFYYWPAPTERSKKKMNKKRVQELADFFYSSDDSNIVPLRISVTTGGYTGEDLNKENFVKLLYILNNSVHLKEDLLKFREDLEDEE